MQHSGQATYDEVSKHVVEHNEISWRMWSDVPGWVYLAEVIILTRSVCLLARNPFLKNICNNPLKPSGHYTYHQVQHSTILRSVHTVYLCVLCGSQNKQPLFPYTTLTDWFVCLLRGTDWIHISHTLRSLLITATQLCPTCHTRLYFRCFVFCYLSPNEVSGVAISLCLYVRSQLLTSSRTCRATVNIFLYRLPGNVGGHSNGTNTWQ